MKTLIQSVRSWFLGSVENPPSYQFSRWLFLRVLSVIYLSAFVSVWVQVDGLVGSNGILPARDYFDAVKQQLGIGGICQVPSLCWISAGDGFLHALCAGGVLVSILAFFNIVPTFCFFCLWLFYLSLVTAGQIFLSYQWDTLLLETGMLAIFFAPMQWLPKLSNEKRVSVLVLFLYYWLLFRLMFGSGLVKLASGDAAWRDWTAMTYHYFTQPIPVWSSWYTHHLPLWLHKTSVAMMFVIELLVPVLVFFYGKFRLIAFIGLVSLQVMILTTGNYGFFNLLSIGLCILLLEDRYLLRLVPTKWKTFIPNVSGRPLERRYKRGVICAFAGFYLCISILVFATQVFRSSIPNFAYTILRTTSPFMSVNRYGLFAVMTTTRPEIIVEGSNDGMEWKPYIFRWKAVELDHIAGFCQPHLPRLDWQMWFAALGRYEQNRWYVQFIGKLLEGNETVLALLKENPFPDQPPKYVRSILYQYEFTDWDEEVKWWKRTELGEYCPVLMLSDNAGRENEEK